MGAASHQPQRRGAGKWLDRTVAVRVKRARLLYKRRGKAFELTAFLACAPVCSVEGNRGMSQRHLNPADAISDFYHQLYLIRRVEERISEIYPSDKIKSPVHLSIGQEAVAVGVCRALRQDDFVSGTYRGHATYLARGGDLRGMFAELYGKASGVARGDVFEIYDRTMALLDHVRTGKGPAFLECHTYRWREHVGPGEDYDAGYRDRAELTAWQAKDPVALLGSALPPKQRQKIETEIVRLIEDAVNFAESSREPIAEELLAHVYA